MRDGKTTYRPATVQSVAFTGTAGTISNAMGNVYVARVVVTEPAHIAIGKSPTATTSDLYIPADVVEYFSVSPGEKVSAIQITGGSGGTLYVTEMT